MEFLLCITVLSSSVLIFFVYTIKLFLHYCI